MLENQNNHFVTSEDISLCIAAVDELISLQLNEILHHPDFQSLEANWRGLYYLVNQKESTLRVKIKILNVSKSELFDDFERALSIEASAIYTKIYSDIYQRDYDYAYGLLIGAYEFDHGPKDMAVIENMAEISAKAHAPFVAGVSPSMFFWEGFEEVDDIRDMSRLCGWTHHNRWNSFRETEKARYVGLCMPHISLRDAYKTFQKSPKKQNVLWGNAAFAFAGCVTRAYDEKSWLGKMRGIDTDGAIKGLSFQTDSKNIENKKDLLDADLSGQLAAISDLGFMSLVDDMGGKLYFFNSQSTHKPKIHESEMAASFSRSQSQLENVLAASRFAVNIMSLRLDNSYKLTNAEKIETFLLNWLSQYYQPYENAPEEEKARRPLREFNLTVEEIPGKPGDYQCVLFIRPTYQLDDTVIAMRVEIYLAAPG